MPEDWGGLSDFCSSLTDTSMLLWIIQVNYVDKCCFLFIKIVHFDEFSSKKAYFLNRNVKQNHIMNIVSKLVEH